jgi:glyoxylase-like metal-dependent hydrolase (beta-lactamase superfamily II)
MEHILLCLPEPGDIPDRLNCPDNLPLPVVERACRAHQDDFPPTRADRRLKGEEEILAFGGEELHCLHTPGHTPGSIAVWLDRNGKRVLFGQDIHGPFMSAFRSNINDWRASMKKILALEPDILCEGHFGIFAPKEQAAAYIHRYLRMNG